LQSSSFKGFLGRIFTSLYYYDNDNTICGVLELN